VRSRRPEHGLRAKASLGAATVQGMQASGDHEPTSTSHDAANEDVRRLVSKYRTTGPRYTSYPTALQFQSMDEGDAVLRLESAAIREDEPWSVYVHVPFCEKRCSFCACAVVASPERERVSAPYVDAVVRELDLVASRIGRRRKLAQLHLGGGTPTYLEPDLLAHLYAEIDRRFERLPGEERSIELDPRVTTPWHLDVLGKAGITRVSLGVQDLDAHVQELIGRHQSAECTRMLVEGVRARGPFGVNLDLVYGLPGQTITSMAATVRDVIDLAPDRVALYGYAHVPWMRGNQKRIDETELPTAEARLEMFLAAREAFLAAGYVAIGLDHFARPTDDLAIAVHDGRLMRNFMGYTVAAGTDLLGLGVTAIGDVSGSMLQNTPKLSRYLEHTAAGRLPIEKGLHRTADDHLRGRVITDLMCRHVVDKRAVARDFELRSAGIVAPDDLAAAFDARFANELRRITTMIEDGLVQDSDGWLRVTERGAPFVRNVAMAFDAHLQAPGAAASGPESQGNQASRPTESLHTIGKAPARRHSSTV
jgi:oxygen-independent coproporphyrinogen-3 oxidase